MCPSPLRTKPAGDEIIRLFTAEAVESALAVNQPALLQRKYPADILAFLAFLLNEIFVFLST